MVRGWFAKQILNRDSWQKKVILFQDVFIWVKSTCIGGGLSTIASWYLEDCLAGRHFVLGLMRFLDGKSCSRHFSNSMGSVEDGVRWGLGDSIRDLLPHYLEVTNDLWKGRVFTIPKKVTKNCEGWFLLDGNIYNRFLPSASCGVSIKLLKLPMWDPVILRVKKIIQLIKKERKNMFFEPPKDWISAELIAN